MCSDNAVGNPRRTSRDAAPDSVGGIEASFWLEVGRRVAGAYQRRCARKGQGSQPTGAQFRPRIGKTPERSPCRARSSGSRSLLRCGRGEMSAETQDERRARSPAGFAIAIRGQIYVANEAFPHGFGRNHGVGPTTCSGNDVGCNRCAGDGKGMRKGTCREAPRRSECHCPHSPGTAAAGTSTAFCSSKIELTFYNSTTRTQKGVYFKSQFIRL